MSIFYILEIEIKDEEEIVKFKETISNTSYDNAYNGKKYEHKIMTIHSSKWLEFKQVVLYASYFQLYLDRDKNDHYVATTMAKDRLVILLNNENYVKHVNCITINSRLNSIKKIMIVRISSNEKI